MKDELPAIAKAASRIAAAINVATDRFARKHRYNAGADLRGQAKAVAKQTLRAWHDTGSKLQSVERLVHMVDDLKIEISIADLVHAWGSKAELEAICRLVRDLGRQVGGWRKKLQSQGQSAAAACQPQRAQILSAHPASAGANP